MAARADSSATLPLQHFLSKDPNLLNDTIHFRACDVLHLTRRLETAAKSVSLISSSLDSQDDDVCGFVSQLVHCFVATGETTRVARGLERILIATGAECQDLVKKKLGEELACVLARVSSSSKDLKTVSNMLEYSKVVQTVIPDHMSLLLEQLQSSLSRLMESPPAVLGREDAEKLYLTVKLCLQLFQLFPDLRQKGWSHLQQLVKAEVDGPGDRTNSVAAIVGGILSLLVKKSCARETSMLAGTAISMAINSAPTPEDCAQSFFFVYAAVSGDALLPQLKALQLKDATTNNIPSKDQKLTSEIAILRSIIIGSSQDLLCCAVNHLNRTSSQPQAFLLTLFPIVCDICDSGTEFQYLSFQLLSLWFQKLKTCLPALSPQGKQSNLMSKDSAIIAETLKRVCVSWDSPVDGVSEFVAEVFQILMEVWRAEVDGGRSDYTQLAEELMRKVVQMPWYARSRYKPLSLLIPYVDSEKMLIEKATIKEELMRCMGETFLAALASDVHTAFLQSISRNNQSVEEQAQKWKNIWLPCVVFGLTSGDNRLRNKICAYWLPSTLKILPATGRLLRCHFEETLQAEGGNSDHSRVLFAWIAVCRHIRTLAGLDLAKLPRILLLEAVYSDDEDICAEALALLSATQKKAEPLGEVEIELLEAALPYCLKMDSAPFRQMLLTSLKKLFVRVRDSCSTALKKKTRAQFVDPSLQFIEWLYNLMVKNVVPGACFQRRRTCLDIIQGWLENIIFVETDGAKKGKAQSPADALIKYAQNQGIWDFFSPHNRTSLLHCIADGADEIQASARHILSKYFPWTPEGSSTATSSSYDLALHLLCHGLDLCKSPRAYENSSGSQLIKLVYQKFVRDQNYHFHCVGDETEDEQQLPQGEVNSEACAAFFNNVLLGRIEMSLKAAEKDALFASKCNPTYGVLQALCECLSLEGDSPRVLVSEDWQKILLKTIALSSSTVTLVLNILAGGQTGNCPSFEAMGVALEQLIGEGSAEQEVTSSISPEFQLLLSWCWNNLKESCTCLGVAVALANKPDQGKDVSLLSSDVIESVGETFIRVLTHCRHRGAIEGCRNGFLQFCTSLMLCGDSNLSSVPANILNQVLSNLEKDQMTSSVTRRSAGLPIIVQTIAQAEKRCKLNKLLLETVTRLYSIASRPHRNESDQTQDEAPVHALNILKAVFSDASLSRDLLSHLGNMTQLVIRSFESSSWALRNAATQLVSTLVTRMFGQRNKASISCNMMTLQEFDAHFPELLAFVECKLAEGLHGGDSITDVQPSLFLILTQLASLGPAAESAQCHRLTATLRATVLDAVYSPVYFLRELSATAVVSLTPLDATETCVTEMLGRLAPGSASFESSNSVHGTLMCLDKLLASRTISVPSAEDIVGHVLNNKRLISATAVCPLVSAKCVEVLGRAVPVLTTASSTKQALLTSLMECVFSLSCAQLQLGQSVYIRSAISLIFSLLYEDERSSPASLSHFVSQCLGSKDTEVRTALLECVLQNQAVLGSTDGVALLKSLWHHLTRETDPTCVMSICKLLTAYHLSRPSSAGLDTDLCPDDICVLRSRFAKLACVQATLFPVEALVLPWQLGQETDAVVAESLSASLCDFSSRLHKFSQPHQNEDFRMAAAQALSLAGQAVFSCFIKSILKALEPAVVSLVEACMLLLVETDSSIRGVVTDFVGGLQWDKKNPKVSHMNSSLCSKVFLAYLCDEMGQCHSVQLLLFNKLYVPGELSTYLLRMTQPRTQYLFEHEENTFYSEKILQQVDIYEALASVPAKKDHSSALPDLLTELSAAVPILENKNAKKAVYNVSGDEGVMAALTGLVMQMQLAAKHSNSQLQAQVALELRKLLQISNLHPGISKFLHCE
ncbi:tRNA (32-2'-O)-methyltransferase regulator THADA-like [Littorina saxatilis]|uniref:DUF2428 domain-containing protein n=1 Tax=Littorina saxatilis TaxID=31220 RepID=A0AAN9GFD2_9CAEN